MGRLYDTAAWRRVRACVVKRDKYRCRRCGAVGALEVHHVKSIQDAPELALAQSNLQTLCRGCHFDATRAEQVAADSKRGRRLKALSEWETLVTDGRAAV